MTEMDSAASPQKTFFGQPRPLATLFGVEMWERFSFYGMQGILLIYLYYTAVEGGLGVPEAVAAGVVGAYGGGLYLSTIVGAWVADRLLSSERVLFYSAILIMGGHLSLALLHGVYGVAIGLVLVAVGSGGVKSNATSLVGALYSQNDPRRDAGFSLFYLGINLGGLFGPILTGLAQSTLGFHVGFAIAAIGMAIGLTQYAFGRKRLPPEARVVPNPLPPSRRLVAGSIVAGGVALLIVLITTGLINYKNLVNIVIGVTLAASIVYFIVIFSSKRVSWVERRRIYAFIPLFIANVAFWALYQQQFTVLTIYSDQRLNRNLFGWEMPVPWVQSINPVFIIILAGIFTALWTRLGSRQPSTPIKFALGTAIMGIAFLLFLPFANGGPNSTPLLAIVGILFVFTIAELLISPVGLSVATKLAPKIFHTQMIALYFLSVALGTALSGSLAEFYNANNEIPYFFILGGIAIVLGIALMLIRKPVLKLMSGVH